MSSSHGSTPSAWTAVGLILTGCVVAAVGVVLLDVWIMAIGAAVVALGPIAGKVMSMMGMGQTASYTHEGAEEQAEGRTQPGTSDAVS
jgi:hypothetical protein